MKDFSATDTLLTALPVVLVLLALIGAVIFFPEGSLFDIRGKAAPTVATPTQVAVPTVPPVPKTETVCAELYKPVCGADQKTYSNTCEAALAKATPVINGECPTTTPVSLPSY